MYRYLQQTIVTILISIFTSFVTLKMYHMLISTVILWEIFMNIIPLQCFDTVGWWQEERLNSLLYCSLKMICNDFLVVKVNCPSYVFNISKSICVLRNIKKLGNFRKSARKCVPDDLFTFASDDVIPGKQTSEQAIGVLSEALHYNTLQ